MLTKDAFGDIFCKKYNKYIDGNMNLIEDTIIQLEKNYERCFGEKPEKIDMESAILFLHLFFAEIMETCPNTKISRAASTLLNIHDENPIILAEKISKYRSR